MMRSTSAIGTGLDPTESNAVAECIESDQLTKRYFLLNVQKNNGVEPEVVRRLKHLRKYYKR